MSIVVKRIFSVVLILLISIFFLSCEKEESVDVYYVKYELKTVSQYKFSTVKIKLTTEYGLETKYVSTQWDGVFGPFKKGNVLKFNIECYDVPDYVVSTTDFTGCISVSENNYPFVLKTKKYSDGSSLFLQYTIGE